jgi:hypothetical protein
MGTRKNATGETQDSGIEVRRKAWRYIYAGWLGFLISGEVVFSVNLPGGPVQEAPWRVLVDYIELGLLAICFILPAIGIWRLRSLTGGLVFVREFLIFGFIVFQIISVPLFGFFLNYYLYHFTGIEWFGQIGTRWLGCISPAPG